jgi:hypothetical protein
MVLQHRQYKGGVMAIPNAARYVVIGAAVHGLSTAYHLGRALREKGQGRGADVVLLEKTRVGAGASGIACGVVRNFYYQPAMNEIMRLSVGVWEEHADVLGYHPVGYSAAVPAPQAEDLITIAKQHAEIGYKSEIVTGEGPWTRAAGRPVPAFLQVGAPQARTGLDSADTWAYTNVTLSVTASRYLRQKARYEVRCCSSLLDLGTADGDRGARATTAPEPGKGHARVACTLSEHHRRVRDTAAHLARGRRAARC